MNDIQLALNFYYPTLILFLDYFGTVAFAVTGAFKAIEHKADLVGVVVLSVITGLSGGVVRDLLFGRIPPLALTDPIYFVIAVVTGFFVFFTYHRIKKHLDTFLKCDAVGLGVFTVIGATTAYSIFGQNFLLIMFGGLITATGGGILRDIIVREMPLVFARELYATASFVGVVIFFVLFITVDPIIAALAGILTATCLRLLAMKYGWNLPKARPS
ncbi:trimeric intracellular cation channel family protein [Candidatus Nitrosocosmicus agrestis]|jgi:uncharacterized membrane protein YeiH|uniref:trimeric intracellular cation channel family protein n=1 Tax=Candidatus Nitrosocosmicus agrestis TaxID=2563600 RepID=UPI00122E8AEB|nr:trimeric intracellular cation channel family protein [Candidatus Nitrosocosmicus sp. SS]KAA2282076.1 trimeric intracellular cation channel family protein [Candidatus Nitrosocosmicus sp. SS]KAF0870079.1 trimeric intracellular cation channel family protein [Candidatus Nitrosocosmicus sp. SS]MDR4492223.1 trimeric intracellular cation channel family protein [Candidatus Nitrosocosmicus sp.]